ncbi:MAG: hypothetical protein Q8R76_04555 [Candidatus Omnitrophota bacterium]|nr:hypothetical protein [Candidatus Omnitrophota bacterium]
MSPRKNPNVILFVLAGAVLFVCCFVLMRQPDFQREWYDFKNQMMNKSIFGDTRNEIASLYEDSARSIKTFFGG